MRLLSDNDWNHITTAYHNHQTLTLEREGPGERITISVSRSESPWPVDMLVGITYWNGHLLERKWCATPSEARDLCRHYERRQ